MTAFFSEIILEESVNNAIFHAWFAASAAAGKEYI